MRKRGRNVKKGAAAVLALAFCLLGFALGRFSAFWGAAVVRGGGERLPLPALETVPCAPDGEDAPFGLIDINTADAETLCLLPGVGPRTAEKIIAYREENGPFASAEEIQAVNGIGQAKYEEMKEYICTGR